MYCIRTSAVVGKVMPTVREVTVLHQNLCCVGTVMPTVREVTGTASELLMF